MKSAFSVTSAGRYARHLLLQYATVISEGLGYISS